MNKSNTNKCPISVINTVKRLHSLFLLSFTFSFLPFGAQAQESREEDKTYELTPFTIEEGSESGYYASQTLAGGRIKQSLKDTGAAVQVVTAEFMEDIGATDIEELLQYTTSSEVAGILGNFTGAEDQDAGAVGTGAARRDPDGTSRIRGTRLPLPRIIQRWNSSYPSRKPAKGQASAAVISQSNKRHCWSDWLPVEPCTQREWNINISPALPIIDTAWSKSKLFVFRSRAPQNAPSA